MSKIGKIPVEVPDGVKVNITATHVEVEGKKGKLQSKILSNISVKQEDKQVIVERLRNDKQSRANYGTMRALVNNMVSGVTNGWTKSLELSGVGFNAKLAGKVLTLTLGYSHDVIINIPDNVDCQVDKTKINLESADKEAVGTIAAKIKKTCPPEPYLGKGIKYEGEQIRRKAGKAAKK